jgi:hypothetical protein
METWEVWKEGSFNARKVCEIFHKRSHPPQNSVSEFFEGPSFLNFRRVTQDEKSRAAKARASDLAISSRAPGKNAPLYFS